MPGQLYASSEGSLPIFSRPPRDSFSPGPIYTWKQAQRWGVTCPRPQSTEGLGQDLGPKPPLLHPLGLFSGGTCPRGGLGAEGARGEGGWATWSSRASLPTRMRQGTEVEVVAPGRPCSSEGGGCGQASGAEKVAVFLTTFRPLWQAGCRVSSRTSLESERFPPLRLPTPW